MLKKSMFIIFLAVGMISLSAEPSPVYHWNFERAGLRTVNGRQVAPGGNNRYLPAGSIVDGGFGGGSALHCEPGANRRQVGVMMMLWPTFTMELRFKSAVEMNATGKPTCLVYFMGNSWRRRYMEMAITPEGKLGVDFRVATDDGKTVRKTFRLEGEAYDFRPGVWYTIRLITESGGKCQLWIDDALYQEADGALAPSDLEGTYPEAYPLLIFGTAYPGDKNERQFSGLIDDVRIWDKLVEPSVWPTATAPIVADKAGKSVSDPNLVLQIATSGPQIDGDVQEPFWQQAEWSEPFTVLERAGAALGAFEKVESVFVQNAAQTAVGADGKMLYLAVKCPVPPEVEYKLTATKDGDNIWRDDCIEFFVRPDSDQPLFFQYLVNADGWKQVIKYHDVGLTDAEFVSQSQARAVRTPEQFNIELAIPVSELGLTDLASASRVTFNVTRCGPTAGGLSTWAPVGQVFANPSRFGKLLPQGRAAYWAGQLAQVTEELANLEVAPGMKASVKPQIVAFQERLEQSGDNPASWDSFTAGIQNLRNSLTRLALAGKPFLLWEGLPWANTPPNLPVPMTATPLETVRLRMARNGKLIHGFAFSNLSEQALMARIKVLPDPLPEKNILYNRAPAADSDAAVLAPKIVFKEGLPMQDQAAQTLPDPLAPLILNTLFRCQPGCTVPLWLEVDTRGLEAGTYRAQVQVQPTYQNLPAQQFRLEVEVVDLDLHAVEVDSFNYYYVKNPSVYRLYRDYGLNYLYCGTPGQRGLDIYPKFDQDGNVVQPADFTQLDEQIDQALVAGMAPDSIKLFFFLAFDYSYWRSLMHAGQRQLEYGTPAWHKGFAAWVAHLKEHLQEKYQIPLSRVVFNPEDESDGKPDDPSSDMHLALSAVQAIKMADSEVKTMLNPNFDPNKCGDLPYLFKRLAEHTDIIEFYRPYLERQPDLVELAKAAGNFEFWTYHILVKSNAPSLYRRLYWQNWNDGFTGVCAFWHMDSHAGGDGFNSFDGAKNTADYGVIYTDQDSDQVITSRRSEAWFQGRIDFQLGQLCQKYLEQAQAKGMVVDREQEELQNIKKQGVKADLEQLEKLRQKLIDLALNLKEKAR